MIPFRSTLQPSFHLSLVLDTIIRISLNKSRDALSSCSLGIFRVALLFICQGTVCCCVPQQLCYLITGFLLCQQLFLTFLSCLLLSAILSCRSNFDILSQLFCFVNNFLNLFRHFRYCSARAIRKATKSRWCLYSNQFRHSAGYFNLINNLTWIIHDNSSHTGRSRIVTVF